MWSRLLSKYGAENVAKTYLIGVSIVNAGTFAGLTKATSDLVKSRSDRTE